METMEKETTIQLRNVTTGYRVKGKDKEISLGLNASLHIGEMTCLLGPNGAGKSTLLRTMAGFQPSLGGEVSVNKKPLKKYSPKDLAKAVSVVLTQNSDIKNLTVEEVLAYVQYNPKKLVRQLEIWVTKSVKQGKISLEEGKEFLSNYRSGLYGYTYLE